jgi:hypothetical protein
MSSAARKVFHRRQVPFSAGPPSSPLAAAASGSAASAGGAPGREARAAAARNAWASMDKVACRYQARYLRTW